MFLNEGVRGPLVKIENGEWLLEFRNILAFDKVGLVGSSMSCEKKPHIQTHAFAIRTYLSNLIDFGSSEGSWKDIIHGFEVSDLL